MFDYQKSREVGPIEEFTGVVVVLVGLLLLVVVWLVEVWLVTIEVCVGLVDCFVKPPSLGRGWPFATDSSGLCGAGWA